MVCYPYYVSFENEYKVKHVRVLYVCRSLLVLVVIRSLYFVRYGRALQEGANDQRACTKVEGPPNTDTSTFHQQPEKI